MKKICADAWLTVVNLDIRALASAKMKLSPFPPWILYHSGVVRVKEKLARGFKKIYEVLGRFASNLALSEGFLAKRGDFRVPPPGIPR